MGQGFGGRNNRARPLPLGVIEVINAVSKGVSLNAQMRLLSVASVSKVDSENRPEKKSRRTLISITFDEVDLEGTS